MPKSIDGGVTPRAHFEQEALVHLDALYSFALKLARARDEAEDLVSDTVLRAFERWEQYRLGTNIRAWLFTNRTRGRAVRRATRAAPRIRRPRSTIRFSTTRSCVRSTRSRTSIARPSC